MITEKGSSLKKVRLLACIEKLFVREMKRNTMRALRLFPSSSSLNELDYQTQQIIQAVDHDTRPQRPGTFQDNAHNPGEHQDVEGRIRGSRQMQAHKEA